MSLHISTDNFADTNFNLAKPPLAAKRKSAPRKFTFSDRDLTRFQGNNIGWDYPHHKRRQLSLELVPGDVLRERIENLSESVVQQSFKPGQLTFRPGQATPRANTPRCGKPSNLVQLSQLRGCQSTHWSPRACAASYTRGVERESSWPHSRIAERTYRTPGQTPAEQAPPTQRDELRMLAPVLDDFESSDDQAACRLSLSSDEDMEEQASSMRCLIANSVNGTVPEYRAWMGKQNEEHASFARQRSNLRKIAQGRQSLPPAQVAQFFFEPTVRPDTPFPGSAAEPESSQLPLQQPQPARASSASAPQLSTDIASLTLAEPTEPGTQAVLNESVASKNFSWTRAFSWWKRKGKQDDKRYQSRTI